jgi:hypothetical protein
MTGHLMEAMATSATGYAAVIDGVLDIRTVTVGPNGAAINALYTLGVGIGMGCQDPLCDCLIEIIPRVTDRIEIVAVSVTKT